MVSSESATLDEIFVLHFKCNLIALEFSASSFDRRLKTSLHKFAREQIQKSRKTFLNEIIEDAISFNLHIFLPLHAHQSENFPHFPVCARLKKNFDLLLPFLRFRSFKCLIEINLNGVGSCLFAFFLQIN